jgi:predicted RNA-binding protein
MDLTLNADLFDKKIDPENGSILFFRKDRRGIPDKVIEGDGFTVEIKDEQLFLIDIFNPEKVFGALLKGIGLEETA